MPIDVVLPALSAGMEEAVIARWLKAEGDAVRKGDLIAEVETDKATMELEAGEDGCIGRILVTDGARAAVNQVIAVLLREGENASILPFSASAVETVAFVPVQPTQAGASVSAGPQAKDNAVRHKASPLARRLAAERGISLATLSGSGPKGRIVRLDVEKAAPVRQPAVPEPASAEAEGKAEAIPAGIGAYEAVPHSSMRRTIARRLLEAKTTIPHFYLSMDCNLDALLALRGQINAGRKAGERISVNDFVIKACAVALRKAPQANVVWTEQALLKLADVDISVAVSTDGGLITPIIRKADQKSLGTISAEMKALAARARENRLKPEEYQGGGFSVSNLGMHGVRSFSAIVNPPQSAILAVGAAERRPVEKDGGLGVATMMTVTLSVDHRTIDGALGASWLSAFRSAIEAPLLLLV